MRYLKELENCVTAYISRDNFSFYFLAFSKTLKLKGQDFVLDLVDTAGQVSLNLTYLKRSERTCEKLYGSQIPHY